jgi:hypothetical protein
MSYTNLAPIIEKAGHRIERRVTEEFRAWCAECDAPVSFWDVSIFEARLILAQHIKRHENANLRD